MTGAPIGRGMAELEGAPSLVALPARVARSVGALAVPGALARATAELRALFDEVAEVDWSRGDWAAVVRAIAVSEVMAGRAPSPSAASSAFVEALRANSSPAADTFMARPGAAPPRDRGARIELAVERAFRVAETLRRLDGAAPDQPLVAALALEAGWLRARPIERHGVPVAFLAGAHAWRVEIAPGDDRAAVARGLAAALSGAPGPGVVPVDPRASAPTPAAAAIAVDPVTRRDARSFHRATWSRGGGPWMGVADTADLAVVSTCHAAVDGYVHAKVCDAVLGPVARERSGGPAAAPLRWRGEPPPEVGFATCRVTPAPRFAQAVHAFGVVLADELGAPGARSRTPFHIPIAPGVPGDDARWRRRPIYGLFALTARDGRLEDAGSVAARLPRWLAREASGAGLLTRVLRATVELPLPSRARRRLIARRPWMDRTLEAARVLTGSGYLSWMRFEPGEEPAHPTHPSAVPSFTDDQGGAGLSIVHGADGLSVGLTTSGALATDAAAARFLEAWRAALEPAG